MMKMPATLLLVIALVTITTGTTEGKIRGQADEGTPVTVPVSARGHSRKLGSNGGNGNGNGDTSSGAVQLMGYGGTPNSHNFPLALCEGDCDYNNDCEGTLVCHQRTNNGPGPTECSGWENFDAKTDFCVYPGNGHGSGNDDDGTNAGVDDDDDDTDDTSILNAETNDNDNNNEGTTDNNNNQQQQQQVTTDGLLPLTIVEAENSNTNNGGDGLPLGLCQGDCDTDSDCLDDFTCFQRDMVESVPGCMGDGLASMDYCIRSSSSSSSSSSGGGSQNVVIVQNYNSFTIINSGLQLESISDNTSGSSLGLCQGDCDTDNDCWDNFICFQRDNLEAVPGCNGLGRTSYDYCIVDPRNNGGNNNGNTSNGGGNDGSNNNGGAVVVTTGGGTPNTGGIAYGTAVYLMIITVHTNTVSTSGEGQFLAQPLGLCQGDCSTDADCLDDLICFQRDDQDENVPGCLGLGEVSADYCVFASDATRAPSVVPVGTTLAPAVAPTTNTDLTELQFVVDGVVEPLGICQGDCDNDGDCLDQLVCFQRDTMEAVPGCAGDGDMSFDYCVINPASPPSASVDVGGSVTVIELDGGVMLQYVINSGDAPLGLCQGDCDTDDDCLDNLVCFQRDYLEAVPGCVGLGSRSYDYCVVGGPGIQISGGIQQTNCNQDSLSCSDGTIVGRDPTNGCAYYPCPTIDTSICQSNSVCATFADCRAEAEALGLQLGGSEFAFTGNYPVKGCHFYANGSGSYANQAYFGTGATSCMDIMVDPADGAQRLQCPAIVVVVASANTIPPVTSPPTPQPTRRPTNTPVADPTPQPTPLPTPCPTRQPTSAPVPDPTPRPTEQPTPQPTRQPTRQPTNAPVPDPTPLPTEEPTPQPTRRPTRRPTSAPVAAPTPPPTMGPTIDTSLCQQASLCGSFTECLDEAQRIGLQLGGNEYNFSGDYGVKGCHFYPDGSGDYANQAFWGTGATSCDAIAVAPQDGAFRLDCPTTVLVVVGGTSTLRTEVPTFSPTNPPTPVPTGRSTDPPVAPLTDPPVTPTPTPVPTSRPTNPPVVPPTNRPVTPAPTDRPTSPPVPPRTNPPVTSRPTGRPTNPPVTPGPTDRPAIPPVTPRPTGRPTNPPVTPQPTTKPTNNPTRRPTNAPLPVCTSEMQQCLDGTFVQRDQTNDCTFFPCSSGVSPCPTGELECADGSIVSRVPPGCQFESCPAIVIEAAQTAPPVTPNPTPPPTDPPIDPSGGCGNELRECADGSFVGRNPDVNCLFFSCPNNEVACANDLFQCLDGSTVTRQSPHCFFADCPVIIIIEAAQTVAPVQQPVQAVAQPVSPPTLAPAIVIESAQTAPTTESSSSKDDDIDCLDGVPVSSAFGVGGKGKGGKGKGGRGRGRDRDRDRTRRRARGRRKLQDGSVMMEPTETRQGCGDRSSTTTAARIRASSSSSNLDVMEADVESSAPASTAGRGLSRFAALVVLACGYMLW